MQHSQTISTTIDEQSTILSSQIAVRKQRFAALDIQRGVIMMLMAFSHCREYVGVDHYSNITYEKSSAWQGSNLLDLIQQIIVSTVAAGGFYMMMGIGIVFLFQSRLKGGWSTEKTCLYLIKRGCLLIFIQLTLLQAFEMVSSHALFFYAGTLLSLGIDMIFASLCLFLTDKLKTMLAIKNNSINYFLPLLAIIIITILMQLLINGIHQQSIEPSAWVMILLERNLHYGIDLHINFTPISWFPAVAFGLIIGNALYFHPNKSFKFLFKIAFILLLSWFFIRTGNLLHWFNFGDYKYLLPNETMSFASYFCMSKHPPSVAYFLWGLGLNLFFISIWQLSEEYFPLLFNAINPVKIFGRCALLFFTMHWFVYSGISLFLPQMSTPLELITIWLIGLVPLYFFCKWFYAFKLKKPATSIWRMF